MQNRLLCTLLTVLLFTSLAFAQGPGSLKNGERPFSSDNVKHLAGNRRYVEAFTKTVSIKGMPYDGYIIYWDGGGGWDTFDIRGWDKFIAQVGISDDETGKSSTVTVEVDGNTVTKLTVRSGDKAVLLEVPLANCSTLTLRTTYKTWFAQPRLVKGDITPQFACQKCGQQFTSQKALSDHLNSAHGGGGGSTIISTSTTISNVAATFVVDPNDLDKLATSLRKRVDAKPAIQQKLSDGYIAVMTFDLVDIPSVSVGKNVAEDLSTSLINNDFQLAERGQLDKALKELKIQDSALIDQATAQKLGQITGCNYLIVGSVSDRGQFLVINARFLETATGKSVAAERVECRKIEIKR